MTGAPQDTGASTASRDDSKQVFDFRKPGREDAPGQPRYRLTRPVFLVGFMGAGKTSVSRKLARNAGVTAIDMDTFIQRRCGKKTAEIFAESGEAGFRAIETDVLRELAHGEPRLVSCGGGVVLAAENREILRASGFVLYLEVTAAEAASRITNFSSRPLFGDLENAQRVIDGRLPLYEEVADARIDTAGRGTGSIAREALALLRKERVLVEAV